ncbi:ArsR family transcriptional regulator [Candidatus Woesearchaeota archaeon]|nr:ArsR family transcriptional regulator [Candidatus Woesearchaeota archaeon]
MDWEAYSFVIRSGYRKAVLKALEVERTPSQIAVQAKIANSHASRALAELEKKKLVLCLTPKVVTGRIYALTLLGKDILKQLQKAL